MNVNEISKILKDAIEDLGYLLIDIEFKGDDRNRIIEIYIDNEAGINTDDCVDVTRVCGDIIEEKDLIESKYRLDVSSPGTERPMKYIQQFEKHIGRKIELEFEDQAAEKFQWRLKEVDNDVLRFEVDNKIEEVKFNNIKSAKIIVGF